MNTRTIRMTNNNLLFSKSAGRCNLCFREVPDKGERAHIIAHSGNGPRGNIPFDGDINSYENLILLCPNCHSEVDKNPEKYSVDDLRDIKSKHEKFISSQLSTCSKKRLNDIFCIKQLVIYGDLFDLKRYIRDLPKSVDSDFFNFRDVLNELEFFPNIYPVNDTRLYTLLKNLIISFETLEDHIRAYTEYEGRIFYNFGSPPGINKIYRLREGLPYDMENKIDLDIKDKKEEFLSNYNNLMEYIRGEYPEIFNE